MMKIKKGAFQGGGAGKQCQTSVLGVSIMEVIGDLSKNNFIGRMGTKAMLEWIEELMGKSDYIQFFQEILLYKWGEK